MQTIESINEMQSLALGLRCEGKHIGLVPTLGNLHEGHLSLVDYAKKKADVLIVSLFLNPAQFGPNEDYKSYPRTRKNDLKMCKERGADIVFIPDSEAIYPDDYSTYVAEEKLSEGLCGISRPLFFRGVATVVAILFNIVRPDFAVFGQKDAQQCAIIKRMVRDLRIPIDIIVCPTVRDKDGLALSSRNAYLNAAQRKDACAIYKSLQKAEKMITDGILNADRISAEINYLLSENPRLSVLYVSIVERDTMEPLKEIKRGHTLIAIAAWCDTIRLIDNVLV